MENHPANLLEPDILLSHGYWENFCSKIALCPEKMLMLAVLEDAVDCIRKRSRIPSSQEFRAAADWILEEKTEWPFSFENICAALGLEADYIRDGMLDWNGKKAAKTKPLPRKEGSNLPWPKPARPSAILRHAYRNFTPKRIQIRRVPTLLPRTKEMARQLLDVVDRPIVGESYAAL